MTMETTTTPATAHKVFTEAVVGYTQRDADGLIDEILCVECAKATGSTAELVNGNGVAGYDAPEMCWGCELQFQDAWAVQVVEHLAQHKWGAGEQAGVDWAVYIGDERPVPAHVDPKVPYPTRHASFVGDWAGVMELALYPISGLEAPTDDVMLTERLGISSDVVPGGEVWWIDGKTYLAETTDPTVLGYARFVASDQNQGLDDDEVMGVRDAVENARNILFIPTPDLPYVPGGYPLEDYGDHLTECYRAMLEVSDAVAATLPNWEVVR